MWYDDVIGVNHFDNSAIRQFTSVNMQYGNNGITSKKNGYAEIITADFYRRNAETVINSRKSIIYITYETYCNKTRQSEHQNYKIFNIYIFYFI
jgi:hypothetical protein